ncbi:BexC/CtrB/KpsE family polysaccharide export inner-membrane protein [Xanthobacter flavus]|uniref:BexC/CtrB/KpsE family polysaccharide export inner-membrane protein n=1 Tax=Xanthobacter flavus TaxID=281 RepID=A0A9W6CPW3_XANFL|nr:hypothetical protein [Xanthobacter flavus]MDR6332505.1 BexC/CtrB/KpsE family polysaccharide export inner-membrane protein [Xanthobacter flavus]GLI21743.1 capsule polysaccharide transporter [Xanthobacter flavus]
MGLPSAPPIRVLIERSRAFVVLPFVQPALRWRRLPRTFGTGATASQRWFRLLRLSFVACVLLPAAVCAFYAGVIASPVYVSEARLAVRESLPDRASSDDGEDGTKGAMAGVMKGLSSLFGGGAGGRQAQAPFVLASYITSRSFVAALDADGWLRAFFCRPGLDPLSRLSADATLEDVWRYWNRHVTAAVDRRSEIVLLRVRAFSPEDARTIAQRIVRDGEVLLNDIISRSRADSVTRAADQLNRAKARYVVALARQQEWRGRQRAVDPVQAAEALGTSLLRLEQERISADKEMRSLEKLSAPDGPALGVLRDRVRAIDTEIAAFRASLGGPGGSKGSTVNALAAFEEAEMEVRFAETMQSIAVAGLQEAERRMRAQSAFVNVFVPPSLPTTSTEPSWWRTGLFVLVLAGIFWLNVMVLIAVIRDHRR